MQVIDPIKVVLKPSICLLVVGRGTGKHIRYRHGNFDQCPKASAV